MPGSGRASPPGPVAVWAADRDAHQLYGLDADLLVARRRACAWPVQVEACADGGAWVLRAIEGQPTGSSRLERVASDGSLAAEFALGACADLDRLGPCRALVVEKGEPGRDRLWSFDLVEGRRFHFEGRDLSCALDAGGCILLGTSTGEVVRLDSERGVHDRAVLGGRILDLTSGPAPGTAWALAQDDGARLHLLRLDPCLSIDRSVDLGPAEPRIAPVAGEDRVWVLDAAERSLRRLGPGGDLELRRPALPLAGLDRAVAFGEGEVLIAVPGAILRLDASGRLRPGQGGFEFLVDLSCVPGT